MGDAREFFEGCGLEPFLTGDVLDTAGTTPAETELQNPRADEEFDFDLDDLAGVEALESRLPSGTERVREHLRERGMEAVAFYRPYHLYGPARWGIVFRGDLLNELAATVGDVPTLRDGTSLLEAVAKAVDRHELVHFRTEIAATHTEVTTGSTTLYRSYLESGWTRPLGPHALVEEGLAPFEELRRAAFFSPVLARRLGELVRGVPGYGHFKRYHGPQAQRDARLVLVPALLGDVPSGELFARSTAHEYEASVPRWWVVERGAKTGGISPKSGSLPVKVVLKDSKRRGATVENAANSRHPITIRLGRESCR